MSIGEQLQETIAGGFAVGDTFINIIIIMSTIIKNLSKYHMLMYFSPNRPSNGGKYCLNDRKRYRTCNIELCEEGAPSFRHAQCASFNEIPYKNERYEWTPVSDASKLSLL